MKPVSLAAVAATALCGLLAVFTGESSTHAQPPTGPPPTKRPADAARAGFFEAKVRPLILEKCAPCHNETVQQGNVRLDSRQFALKTVVPGKPAESPFLKVVHYDGKIKMPPTGKLGAAEIAVLEKWVADGAYWPDAPPATKANVAPGLHWSFVPIRRRPLEPPVMARGVDAFIVAELTRRGLTLAPRADRATLLRRLSYDLTGLPPTPAEVEAFRKDARPDAYARQVDRLLASPRYGERWARHWLDVARYADSNGLDENLAHGNAYHYRDWTIDAHNRDLPYDEFLRQQIAGDLLPTDDEEERNRRITATGFLTLGAKVLAEQDKPKLVMDIVDEQIEVVTKATMGLTVACARCHDHKFDPISTKDYYALAGVFKSTKTMANLDFVSRWNERPLPTKKRQEEIARYQTDVLQPVEARLKSVTEAANRRVTERLRADAPKYARVALEYARQPGALVPTEGGNIAGRQVVEAETFARGNALKNTDGYGAGIGVIHTGEAPTRAEWDVTVPAAGAYQWDFRYAAEEARPVRLLVNGKEVKKDALAETTGSWNPDGQQWEAVAVVSLNAGKNTLKLERNGPIPHVDKLALTLVPSAPTGATPPKTLAQMAKESGLDAGVLRRVAFHVAGAGDEATAINRARESDAFTRIEKPEALYAAADAEVVRQATGERDKARAVAPKVPSVMAVAEMDKAENVRVHVRGDTQNLGDVVKRGFPKILTRAGYDVPEGAGSGRLEMARWLTAPDHPLTARVAANRVWLHLFGEGLVRTPDNWGLRGEKPTHPELLDWLAWTFVRDDGWSLKKLIRRVVLSDTYQQASRVSNPKAVQADPDNRLLWRQNLRRLEAEPLRDSFYAVAGTLDVTTGGTLLGTQNGGYVTNDQSGNGARYDLPRRSIYLPVIRNAVYDFFSVFDFGDPTMVNAQRSATTVSSQALYLLNSPMVRDQARAFAQSLLRENTPDDRRARLAVYRAFGRPATTGEGQRGVAFVRRVEELYTGKETDPAKRRELAWAAYCQTLYASNEFIYVR
jgi:hypothetical protein